MEILQFPALSDNYFFLLLSGGKTAVVDTPEAEPIVAALEARGLGLDFILNTHHHRDHVGGNLELKEKYGCRVLGPTIDKIPGIDEAFSGGEVFDFGGEEITVMKAHGHTKGHIAYFVASAPALFCGDSLFSLGCGKLFEGTPEQMWETLSSYRGLPGNTRIYCAHEYTLENAQFAQLADPQNPALHEMVARATILREGGRPTVPSLLSEELGANPFLRPESETLQKFVGKTGADLWRIAGALREAKDRFDAGDLP
jgi:hydroxyacylglutathione hydrolase